MKNHSPDPAPAATKNARLWLEGISDALGFLVGTTVGFVIGRLAGLNIFAEGYSMGTMGGILLVGLGGGLGLQGARHWRRGQEQKRRDAEAAAGQK